MIVIPSRIRNRRFSSDAGIAIGPILFIIAVLGILAAAIAAGSGSFTTSTTGESNRAKAAAIIDIGQNLKIGHDRIIGSGVVEFADVNIDPTSVENVDDLFSPLGGGISPPSVTMAATPASDIWHYPLVAIPGICTAAGGCRLAIIAVTEPVCTEINSKANALATPASFAIDDLFADTGTTPVDTTNWPAAFDGKPTGCIEVDADATMAAGFYFYQVIGIQ